MKLVVRKLWYRGDLEATMQALFKIPQLRKRFDEGYFYEGEMRPRGLKICPGYWKAYPILELIPKSQEAVHLVLTSLDLRGEHGRISGTGMDKKALASNDAFIGGSKREIFNPADPQFNGMVFGEIGHALGTQHHPYNWLDPCEMSHNYHPSADWQSLEEIRFCDACQKVFSRQNII
ncbi:MAG: hypothetical protein AABW80_00690 [Nanoarchaeota archaeon]